MAAIEERDGAAFYVQRTSPVRPMALVRTPGFTALAPRARQRRRDLRCVRRRAARRAARLARLDRRAARRRRAAARRARRAGASVAIARARRARAGAHAGADRPRLGTRGAARLRSAALAEHARASRAAVDLLEHHRGAAVAARRARSASTLPPPPTGPGATASGSVRSSAGGWRQSPLLLPWSEGALREAPAAARRRRSRARAAGAGRAVGPARAASATSRPSPTPRTPPRRASTACSRRGERACARRRRGQRRRRAGRGGRSAARAARARAVASPGRGACALSARCPREEYRALLRRARVFVCAPRREDYGIAQLEALADGCMLVTTPAPGPYVALPIARALDAAAGRRGPRGRAARRAGATRARLRRSARREALAPFSRAAVDRRGRRRAAAAAARSRVGPNAGNTGCRDRRRQGSAKSRATASPTCDRRRALAQLPQLRHATCVGACPRRVSHARRAVATPQRMFASVPCGGRRSRSRSCTPGARGGARVTSERSRRSGLALISSIVPRARGRREDRVEVERVGRAALDQAARRVADRVHQRVLDRRDHALGHRAVADRRRPCARSRPPSRARASSSSS